MAEKQKKRKTCQICGGLYVPTGNSQKYCPECRKELQLHGGISEAYLSYRNARTSGPVTVSMIELPENELQPEEEERSGLPETWEEEQKKLQLPDWDAFVAQATEILLRYGRGELVDKTEFLARIQEKLDDL